MTEKPTLRFFLLQSNCHHGLSGVSFEHFLINQVVEGLRHDLENIKHFVTLSPVPNLRRWIANTLIEPLPEKPRADVATARGILDSQRAAEIAEDAQAGLHRVGHLLFARSEAGR